jgi:uncharacterized membrane protein
VQQVLAISVNGLLRLQQPAEKSFRANCNPHAAVFEFTNATPAQSNFGAKHMTPIKTATTIAATAASLALAALASAATPPAGSMGAAVNGTDTVHCYGVNSCKGTADCKTTDHECKGMNVCKGHGFKAMKANACLKAGGTIGDLN